MDQDNATIVRRFVEEAITQGKIDSAAQYVWEDVVEQVPLPGQGPGLDGLKDALRALRAGFPDISVLYPGASDGRRQGRQPLRMDRPTRESFSVFPEQAGLCASGAWS